MPATKSRPAVFEILAASGPGAPSTEDKLRVVSKMRRDQPQMSPQLDGFLIEQAAGSRAEARETKAYVKELETVVDFDELSRNPCPVPDPTHTAFEDGVYLELRSYFGYLRRLTLERER